MFTLVLAACGAGTSVTSFPTGPGSGGHAPGGSGAATPTPGPNSTPTSAPSQATSIAVTVIFPAAGAATNARGRRNAATPESPLSVTVAIEGGTPVAIDAPAASAASQTVTMVLPAPAGPDTFAIGEYSGANGSGTLLGSLALAQTLVTGPDNALTIDVNGDLEKIVIEAVPNPFLEGTVASGVTLVGDQPQMFYAVPEDAAGNALVSGGLNASVTETSAAPNAMVVAPGSGEPFTLQAPAPTAAVNHRVRKKL